MPGLAIAGVEGDVLGVGVNADDFADLALDAGLSESLSCVLASVLRDAVAAGNLTRPFTRNTTGGTDVPPVLRMKQLFQCPRRDTHLNHTHPAQRLSGVSNSRR